MTQYITKIIPFLSLSLFFSCTSKAAIEPITLEPKTWPKAPLQVWSVSPHWGLFKNDGFKISIHGVGFEEGAKAFVGEKPCLSTRVKSHRLIRCKLPEQDAPGDYPVIVINPDGTLAPIPLTQQEIEELDEEDQGSDGRVYFYYVKPIQQR